VHPLMLSLLQTSSIPPFSWTTWSGDGTLRAGLLLLVGGYLLGIGPLRERFRLGPPVPRSRVAVYLSGVLLLFIALEGPLHELSDTYLFSAHMVQHMLLIMFAPPLLLLGTPGWLLRPIVRQRAVFPIARALTRALPAGFLLNVVFTAYHWPRFYNAVAADHNLHIATHLIFIALAAIMWWPLVSPLAELPPLPYPLRMMYVFAQTIPGFILGTFITHAQTALYPTYALAPPVWGLSPLDDQRLGGLIMWVLGGLYLLFVFSAIFFAWAHKENVADEVSEAPRRPPSCTPYPYDGIPRPVNAPTAGRGREPVALGARHVPAPPDRTRLN